MTTYRCDSIEGYDQRDVEAASAEQAAEVWAERAWESSSGEAGPGVVTTLELDPAGEPIGEARRFSVELGWTPTFSAWPE